MKNKIAIFAPLFVSVILFLVPLSEKLLLLTVNTDSNILISASAVQLFIFAVPAAFYCKFRNADFLKHSKVHRLSISDVPFVTAATFTYFLAALLMLYIQYHFFPTSSDSALTTAIRTSAPFETALAYVIIPAIAEELFFRSILLSDYSEYNGPCAVAVSSLFFAMLHFSFELMPMYFLLGMILATITYITGTSFPAIIIHMINNALVIFLGDRISVFLAESSSSVILAFLLAVAFMASLAMTLSTMENIYERRSILYEYGELSGSRKEAVSKLSRAGRVEEKEEKSIHKVVGIFLSPTFFLTIFLFVLITLDII